jgi:hypothetical protein
MAGIPIAFIVSAEWEKFDGKSRKIDNLKDVV